MLDLMGRRGAARVAAAHDAFAEARRLAQRFVGHAIHAEGARAEAVAERGTWNPAPKPGVRRTAPS
jgi:hypothetical protein